jgi:hypothetical protein
MVLRDIIYFVAGDRTLKTCDQEKHMVDVAQLVRAPDCGSGGRGFDPHHSPHSI